MDRIRFKGPYRPKGPQRPLNPFKERRTNWIGAGPGSAYARFWPSNANIGAVIEMYDKKKYIMANEGMRRINESLVVRKGRR